jgi:transketolase C-terminal domain/subunit
LLNGGLGSIVLELFSDFQITKRVKRIGLKFSEYPSTFGNREYYMKLCGLSGDQIIETIVSFYENKYIICRINAYFASFCLNAFVHV